MSPKQSKVTGKAGKQFSKSQIRRYLRTLVTFNPYVDLFVVNNCLERSLMYLFRRAMHHDHRVVLNMGKSEAVHEVQFSANLAALAASFALKAGSFASPSMPKPKRSLLLLFLSSASIVTSGFRFSF